MKPEQINEFIEASEKRTKKQELIPGFAKIMKYGDWDGQGGAVCCLCDGKIEVGEYAVKGHKWAHIRCFGIKVTELEKKFEDVTRYVATKAI